MKKIFLLAFLSLSLNAQSLELDKIRTDLYSKSGANVLKKIEISLEFEGEKLKENENKLTDAVNTVISGFFYEDIFTELGKNNFKNDLEEFKRFLASTEAKEKNVGSEVKKALDNLELPQTPAVPNISNIETPQIDQLFQDDNTQNQYDNGEIDINTLNIPKMTSDIEEKIKRDLIANPPQIFKENNSSEEKGFELNLDTNSTMP